MRCTNLCALTFLTGILTSSAAFSQDGLPPGFASPLSWFTVDGDTQLPPLLSTDSGISFEPLYTGEVFSNTRGGKSTNGATRYSALLDLALSVDLEQLANGLPGRVFVLAQNTHGEGLTENYVGDTQVVSNIDAFADLMQVSEYWWETALCDGDLRVRLGKQDINTEFLLMPTAGAFIHSSFGLSPTAGLPSYPDPSLAAVAMAQLSDSLQVKIGIWDALAKGATWGYSRSQITLTIGEVEFNYQLGEGRLPGVIAMGLAYGTSGSIRGLEIPATQGFYVQIEQRLIAEQPSLGESPQGLAVFAQYSLTSESDVIDLALIPEDATAGLTYTGLLPHRDADILGAGVAWAKLDQGGTNRELAIELFYRALLTPRLTVQPDLQYIATPSGLYPDSLVVGTRFQIVF